MLTLAKLAQALHDGKLSPPRIVTDEEMAERNRERGKTCPPGCLCKSCEARR